MVFSSLLVEDLICQLRASVKCYAKNNKVSYLEERLADSFIESDIDNQNLAQLCADSLIGMAFFNKDIPITTRDQEMELFHAISAINLFLRTVIGKNYLISNKDKFYSLNTLLRERPFKRDSILNWYLNF